MNDLLQSAFPEFVLVQNSALGAFLVWRFACGYQAERLGRPVPIPMHLCWTVLPAVFHEATATIILRTRESSGLRRFADKMRKRRQLIHFHRRVSELRAVSLESLLMAAAQGLVAIDYQHGTMMPLTHTPPCGLRPQVDEMRRAAERWGTWLADYPLVQEIGTILQVRF